MKEFDPNGIFLNAFGRRLIGVCSLTSSDSEVRHCALLDNCVCAWDTDCAVGQRCSRIQGYPNFPVCKSPPRDPTDNRLHPEPLSLHGVADYADHLTRLMSTKLFGWI